MINPKLIAKPTLTQLHPAGFRSDSESTELIGLTMMMPLTTTKENVAKVHAKMSMRLRPVLAKIQVVR